MPLNFSIADIREPDRRNTSFSKTIKIPGTKTNNLLFSNIFDINKVVLSNNSGLNFTPDFNPNLKADAIVYIDTLEQFKGIAQLLQINVNEEHIEYEIILLGSLKNIIAEFGDKKLTDINLSVYDHTWNKAVIKNSWVNTITINGIPTISDMGVGYVYPMIDYALTDGSTYDVEHFFPAIYLKTYIDKMFSDAGFTYQSNFFTSDFFKRLIIPYNGLPELKLTDEEANARQFRVATSENQTISNLSYPNTDGILPVLFPNETGINYDGNDIIDLGIATIPATGKYKFYVSLDLEVSFTGITGGGLIYYALILYKNGLTVLNPDDFNVAVPHIPSSPSTQSDDRTVSYNLEATDFVMGDTVRVFLRITNQVIGSDVDVTILPGSTFSNEFVNGTLTEGEVMDISRVIPKNVLQKDLFTSIVKMFNLYIEPDKDLPTKLLVEPRNDFYSGNITVDWSDKLAVNMPIEIRPVGELQGNEYRFAYKPDSDFYNKDYTEKTDEVYGEHTFDVINDFQKSKKETTVVFSPTPMIGRNENDRVIPFFVQKDEQQSTVNTNVFNPKETNIRLLYYGGELDCDDWTFTSNGGGTTETTYPYAGHFDHPDLPTLSINFGIPLLVYFSSTIGTDNTLFNKYWKQFIEEITDKDSKLLTAYFHLKPTDILKLNFKNYVFFDGAYCILNKIIDYDFVNNELTKVELLKIKSSAPFVPSSTPPIDNDTNVGIIEGGEDEVRDIAATSPWTILEGGEDEVRDIGATSIITKVDGGLN